MRETKIYLERFYSTLKKKERKSFEEEKNIVERNRGDQRFPARKRESHRWREES